MGIGFVEGNQCRKCKKHDSEVGKIIPYTDSQGSFAGLLCSECIKIHEKPYIVICPKCNRIAYKHGGLTYYTDSDIHEFDDFEEFDSNSHRDFEEFDSHQHDDLNEFYSPPFDKEPTSFELMCLECHGKKVAKVKKIRKTKLIIKNFAKDHWKFWISTSIAIIFGIIGLSLI